MAVELFFVSLAAETEGRGWYQFPVLPPEGHITREAIVYEGDTCSPHQEDNSLEVKLSSQGVYFSAMIHNIVVSAENFLSSEWIWKGEWAEHCREAEDIATPAK